MVDVININHIEEQKSEVKPADVEFHKQAATEKLCRTSAGGLREPAELRGLQTSDGQNHGQLETTVICGFYARPSNLEFRVRGVCQ